MAKPSVQRNIGMGRQLGALVAGGGDIAAIGAAAHSAKEDTTAAQ